MLVLLNARPDIATKDAEEIIDFETSLANVKGKMHQIKKILRNGKIVLFLIIRKKSYTLNLTKKYTASEKLFIIQLDFISSLVNYNYKEACV